MSARWQDKAACRGLDAELFFPETDTEAWEAQRICLGCEVQEECLAHALGFREKAGVWGGATERDRRRIIRRSRRAASAAAAG